MVLSKRNRATLIGALAFAAALLVYVLIRPGAPSSAEKPAAADSAESANQARALGQRLAAALKNPPPPEPSSTPPSHEAGPACERCTAENCAAGDDGCDAIANPGDRKLCEEVYACFSDLRNNCSIKGDPLRCWCGTNMLTCYSDTSGPGAANGPCAKQVIAAAKTNEADTIFHQFLNTDLPLGRAARLNVCRGYFCSNDCNVH
jgi:hypothetical protein